MESIIIMISGFLWPFKNKQVKIKEKNQFFFSFYLCVTEQLVSACLFSRVWVAVLKLERDISWFSSWVISLVFGADK